MSCCSSSPAPTAKVNRSIERTVEQERRKQGHLAKLLLLGAGESGKSTIAKQLKILHMSGFTLEEKHSWRTVIIKNIIYALKTLLKQTGEFAASDRRFSIQNTVFHFS